MAENLYKEKLRKFSLEIVQDITPAPLPVPNSTKSFWLHPQNQVNSLADLGSKGNLTPNADVCIIGSGITGISAAFHLSRTLPPSARIVILEAREFCSGATGRNGGHLTAARFLRFSDVAQSSNGDAFDAAKHYALEEHSVLEIVNLIEEYNWASEVDLVSGGHIDLLETPTLEATAREDWEQAKAAGLDFSSVKWIGKDEMEKTYGTTYQGVRIPGYNLWPLKFVTKLYKLAESELGRSSGLLRLHTHTPVTAVTAIPPAESTRSLTNARWSIVTPRGKISCRAVLHATNAYASHLLPQFTRAIVPVRGQIIATRAAVPLSLITRSSWCANDGYEYWFPRPISHPDLDSSEKPLVILGGGRELIKDGVHLEVVGEADDSVVNTDVGIFLRKFLPSTFPDLYEEGIEPEKEWTGIMGLTALEDPFVGPVLSSTGDENAFAGQYISAGFSGHGMPRTYSSAEAVVSLIVHDLAGQSRKEWVAPAWLPDRYLTWNRVEDLRFGQTSNF